MAVIAMTRELATRGGDVAQGLAERLGLSIIHHEAVEHDVAKLSGYSDDEVRRFLEGQSSLIERFRIGKDRIAKYTAHEILELAAKGNVIIRGWGAGYLLRAVPHALCVRICAPMVFRVQTLMERGDFPDQAAARREIERDDAEHGTAMRRLYGGDWRMPWLYAAVLNTARLSVEDCVDHIAQLAESPAFAETPRSLIQLQDQLIAARIRHSLNQRFGAQGIRLGIEPSVCEGKVTLTGALSDPRMVPEIVRQVQQVDGVKAVQSRIEPISFVPAGHV